MRSASCLTAVLLFFSGLIPLAAGEGLLRPAAWKMTVFHKPATFNLAAKNGGFTVTMADAVSGNVHYINSIHQPLPPLDVNGELRLRFKAASTSGEPTHLVICVGAAPGATPPCTRNSVPLTKDATEHEFIIPLAGLNVAGNVFEFIWEGQARRGEELRIADVRLEYSDTTAPATVHWVRPLSGVLRPNDADQRVTGVIQPDRRLEKGVLRVALAAEDQPGTALLEGEFRFQRPETRWTLDAGALPEGRYLLTARVLDSDGRLAATLTDRLFKQAPTAETTDVVNGVIYHRGEPFVPIGLYHAAPANMDNANGCRVEMGQPALSRDEMYADIKDHGFNTVLGHFGLQPERVAQFVESAGRHGLWAVATIAPDLDDGAMDPEPLAGIEAETARANLLGWYGEDEADMGSRMLRARKIYLALKALQPRRLIFAANYRPDALSAVERTGAFLDVLLYDRYEIFAPDSPLQNYADGLRRLAGKKAHPDMALGVTPQAFIFQGPEPTFEQVRAQTYLGLVYGAKAFIFYTYSESDNSPFTAAKAQHPNVPAGMSLNPKRIRWWLPDSALWEGFRQLNAELAELNGLIVANRPGPNATCDTAEVHAAAWRADDGVLLFAVNADGKERTATLRFARDAALSGRMGTAGELAKARAHRMTFAPYETKVYALTE